jgi:hypothetical protein
MRRSVGPGAPIMKSEIERRRHRRAVNMLGRLLFTTRRALEDQLLGHVVCCWRVPDFLHVVANTANVIARTRIIMEHSGALFDIGDAENSVVTPHCH